MKIIAKSRLEVGFAFGMPAIAITEIIAENGGDHTVIDKFQHTEWKGRGKIWLSKRDYVINFIFMKNIVM